jgi:hypothetical protein
MTELAALHRDFQILKWMCAVTLCLQVLTLGLVLNLTARHC